MVERISLNCSNFVDKYALSPLSKDLSTKDKVIAMVSTIAVGVFTLGIFHAVLGIKKLINRKVIDETHNEERAPVVNQADEVAREVLAPNVENRDAGATLIISQINLMDEVVPGISDKSKSEPASDLVHSDEGVQEKSAMVPPPPPPPPPVKGMKKKMVQLDPALLNGLRDRRRDITQEDIKLSAGNYREYPDVEQAVVSKEMRKVNDELLKAIRGSERNMLRHVTEEEKKRPVIKDDKSIGAILKDRIPNGKVQSDEERAKLDPDFDPADWD